MPPRSISGGSLRSTGHLTKSCECLRIYSASAKVRRTLNKRRRKETSMNDLLESAIAAHGGRERWKASKCLTVTAVSGGGLFALKGMPQDPSPREQTVTLLEESASVFPFGQADWRTRFAPYRVALGTGAGVVVRGRADSTESCSAHDLLTARD